MIAADPDAQTSKLNKVRSPPHNAPHASSDVQARANGTHVVSEDWFNKVCVSVRGACNVLARSCSRKRRRPPVQRRTTTPRPAGRCTTCKTATACRSMRMQKCALAAGCTIVSRVGGGPRQYWACLGTCPSWKFQHQSVNLRTCKHLKAHLGGHCHKCVSTLGTLRRR